MSSSSNPTGGRSQEIAEFFARRAQIQSEIQIEEHQAPVEELQRMLAKRRIDEELGGCSPELQAYVRQLKLDFSREMRTNDLVEGRLYKEQKAHEETTKMLESVKNLYMDYRHTINGIEHAMSVGLLPKNAGKIIGEAGVADKKKKEELAKQEGRDAGERS